MSQTDPDPAEETIFEAARQLVDPAKQAAYVDRACENNPVLRERVEQLLRAGQKAKGFFQKQRPLLPPSPPLGATVITIGEGPGSIIGPYKLLQQIGEGGCGVVYMAEQDQPIHRRVALKVIKLGMDTKQVIARFEAERQALALLDHPNIAKVLDAGATESGRPYFVMELVRGVKITDYCGENNLSTHERLALFIQICQAIQHAHQKGIIHRDIKPSNVLVADHDGVSVPKVIDFGIAKTTTDQRLTDKTLFTAFEQFIGTPAYMSPEQAKLSGLDIDTRTDIYSLGVLLYELLIGKTPLDQKELLSAGLEEMRRTIREKEPARPSTRLNAMLGDELTTAARHRRTDPPKLIHLLRGDLDWIVMKALEKDRSRRYETANGLANDIQRHLADEPVVARPPSKLYRFRKSVRRNKGVFAAAGGLALMLLLGALVSTWQAVRAGRAEREQSRLRADADKARQNEAALRLTAQTEAKRAEAAAMDLKLTLSASDFSQAVRFIAEDNGIDALAFLTRSLSGNPTNHAALTRLTTLLAYHSWMSPILIIKHSDAVTSIQFSPDGKRFLTASEDMTARVWEAQTGQPVTGPMKHEGTVVSAQFSPDASRIVTASEDKTARVWDAHTGLAVTDPLKHREALVSARFSPDGKRILTASWDGTARVWDAQTGRPLCEPIKHGRAVACAQFSPDGKRIVTASGDLGEATARIWDAQTGQPMGEPMKHENPVMSALFSPDGKLILTASMDYTARLWDAQTGHQLAEPMRHAEVVSSAQFSPNGKRLVTASGDNTARVWDTQTGKPIGVPMKHGGGVVSAQFSLDGKSVVTSSWDRTARVWDAESGLPLGEPVKHGGLVKSAEFSPDGKRIATASSDNTARVSDVQAGQCLTKPMKHDACVVSAQFSPDGKRVLTASWDRTARVWDAATGGPLTEPMKIGDLVSSAQFSPDGERIVTGSRDGTARVWNARTGQPLTEPLKHGSKFVSAQFSPDGKRIVTASSDRKEATARIWDAQTAKPLAGPMTHGDVVVSARFSPDGRRIVTASYDGTARVWDAQTGQPLIEPVKHGDVVMLAQFSPDGSRVVTASADKTARVWDAQTGLPVSQPLKHGEQVNSAQFNPHGKSIVTASWDETARLWDAQTGLPLAEPMKHSDSLNSAEFSHDGRCVVTASKDATARVWDAETGQPLSEPLRHDNDVNSAQFSPDGTRIVTASWDATARVWDIAPRPGKYPDWLLQLSEAVSGQVLNNLGVLEQTRLDPIDTLNQIRQKLAQGKEDDDWVVWGRWFLADRATRTISPFSKMTVPEYLQNRLKEKTAEPVEGQNRKTPRATKSPSR